MQALILVGGKGTRLRPLTISTPKSIVPIGNQPFLLWQIDLLKKSGIRNIILSLNYQPTAIEKVLGDGSRFGVRLKYVTEPMPMGTAGAYKFAEQFLKNTTIVLNGDILTDTDLKAVIKHHQSCRSLATIVLTEVNNPSAYGLVKIGANSEVKDFLEKPTLHETIDVRTISAGIYVFEPEVSNLIPANKKYSFEYQLFPDLLKRKERFYAFTAFDNYWIDIGTPKRYWQAHQDLISGKIKNIQLENNNKNFHQISDVDDNSIVGRGCHINSGAKIINSVIGENVSIVEGTTVKNSVIWAGTTISSNTVITDSVIGYNCKIGKYVVIKNQCILGNNSVLSDFTHF